MTNEPIMTPIVSTITASPTFIPLWNARPRNHSVNKLPITMASVGQGSVSPADSFMKYTAARLLVIAIANIIYAGIFNPPVVTLVCAPIGLHDCHIEPLCNQRGLLCVLYCNGDLERRLPLAGLPLRTPLQPELASNARA
jgi:hypothetical protein